MFRKLISIALSCAIAVTTLSVVADAKSAKFEDVPIATENVELAEPEEMVPDSLDKVPKLVLRSIDILINIDGAQNRTTFMFGNNSIVTGVKYNGVEKISYTYDLLKRQTKKTLNTTVPFTTSYQYKNIDNYRTSTLIDKISYSDGTALSYTYDANGNILTIADATGTVIASYTYDSLNQLTGATVGSDVYAYTYDNGGNITAKTKNGVEVAYTYGNTEWKDLLTNYNSVDIAYDTIGNPLNWINGEQFTWGGGRQLTGIVKGNDTISYTYNDSGIRTSKTVNGVRTDYYLNGTAIIMQKTGDNVIWYTYDENGNIAGMNYNGSDYWFYRNAQNDVIGIVDSSGAVVAKYTYDDWGKVVAVTDGQGNDISAIATHIANINPIRYRGYYYDTETGLYYLQSRYYDAEVGRFINADNQLPTGDIISNNLFAYCGNNPTSRVDLTGEAWWHWAIAAALVVGCAAATVVTCGGFAAATATVAAISCGVAATATPAATIAAGAFVGSAAVLGTAALTASTSCTTVEQFFDEGNWGVVASTAVGGAFGAAPGIIESRKKGDGFDTYYRLKKKIGKAGEGKEWHHIVEQNQIKKTGFEPSRVHNTDNIISLDKSIHKEISRVYSSKTWYSNGMTVRNWLVGKSFEEQYEFGLRIIREYY